MRGGDSDLRALTALWATDKQQPAHALAVLFFSDISRSLDCAGRVLQSAVGRTGGGPVPGRWGAGGFVSDQVKTASEVTTGSDLSQPASKGKSHKATPNSRGFLPSLL
ncbi:hypothetical protein MRX96_021154 [Rhipicephalus microplus]